MSDPFTKTHGPPRPLGMAARHRRKHEAALRRWERCFQKKEALEKDYDRETRSDEKMRLKSLIVDNDAELQMVEDELKTLESSQSGHAEEISVGELPAVTRTPERTAGYDVFLAYHRPDIAEVKAIGQLLLDKGLQVWLDVWEARPGLVWQNELEHQIQRVGAAAVFVGQEGIGPWQEVEIRGILSEFVQRRLPVIPVLLRDCPEPPPKLPLFLSHLTWVDFRQTYPDPVEHLLYGITGNRPRRKDLSPATLDLSQTLKAALFWRDLLKHQGVDTTTINKTILDLKHRRLEGGQLAAGDYLLDGRFKLLDLIGEGGLAQVWEAYDESEQTGVAVKVLHPQYTEDKTRRERFFRGASLMERLRHPRIARVIEKQCEDGGFHFFVMELVRGDNLYQAVLGRRLSLNERLRIILAVGDALAFAHAQGVVHRDVKPSNVLLGRRWRPKLTDFDLVKVVGAVADTRTEMLGTFPWAAPEVMSDAKKAGVQVDVYGLGMTAIFAFHGTDLPPDVPWELRPLIAALEMNERTRRVLQRAVNRKLEDRWASVGQFCRALQSSFKHALTPQVTRRDHDLSEAEQADPEQSESPGDHGPPEEEVPAQLQAQQRINTHDFHLVLESDGTGFQCHLLRSLEGQASVDFVLPSFHSLPAGLSLRQEAEVHGRELFEALFQGLVGEKYRKCLEKLERRPRSRLRVRLAIDPNVPALAPLFQLDWERMFDGARDSSPGASGPLW